MNTTWTVTATSVRAPFGDGGWQLMICNPNTLIHAVLTGDHAYQWIVTNTVGLVPDQVTGDALLALVADRVERELDNNGLDADHVYVFTVDGPTP